MFSYLCFQVWLLRMAKGKPDKQNRVRNANGLGAGLIGMGKSGGSGGKKISQRVLKASLKKAVKKNFVSDRGASLFKKRASISKSEIVNTNDGDRQVVDVDDTSSHIAELQKIYLKELETIAKRLGISVAEAERRMAAVKRNKP